MKYIRKTVITLIVTLMLGIPVLTSVAFAQGILPSGAPPGGEGDLPTCEYLFTKVNGTRPIDDLPEMKKAFESKEGFDDYLVAASLGDKQGVLRWILGCAVKYGKIRLYMIPFFITFIVQFLLSVAGLIAVLFMVVGGYHYVIGGITEEKENGKKTIMHALMGLIIALSAWIVVNFIQVAFTS